jgi:hypothetical protein
MARTIELLDPKDYAEVLGISEDTTGVVSSSGLAEFCRTAVWRWGLCPKASLTNCVRSRFKSLGIDDEDAHSQYKRTLNDLLLSGDIASVRSRGQLRLARVQPSWIRIGQETGVLVGTIPSTIVGVGFFERSKSDLGRRFRLDHIELMAALREHSITECQMGTWFGSPGYSKSLKRYSGSTTGQLVDLWTSIQGRLAAEGMPIGSPDSVSILSGPTGSIFGRPASELSPTGRWGKPSDKGVWIGKRRGFNSKDMRPLILHVDGQEQVRSIDLYDEEEYRWAILARGVSEGAREQILLIRDGDDVVVRPKCPLPPQIMRVLYLLGEREESWQWRVSENLKETLIKLLVTYELNTVWPDGTTAQI